MTTPQPPDPYSAASAVASSGANASIIPGSALGSSLMTLNTTTLNASSVAPGGVFGYEGVPSTGNLLYSLAPAPGTDQFGNTYPTGVIINAGQLNGVSLVGIGMDATSTLQGTLINNGVMAAPAISGGTAVSTLHVLNSTGGAVLSYTNSGSVATFSTNGTYSWTCPTNVTQAKVECWGGGGGGGGGSSVQGGEGGGGGEYAAEYTLTVVPGQVYQVTVGQGGAGGTTGSAGNSGGASIFADNAGNNLVYANGGQAGLNFQGGVGGVGSSNTVEEVGGTGATASGNTGGNGGGSSAGQLTAGNAGTQSSGATGGAGGGAPTGGGAGGAGGNGAANGVNGSSPGGAGGGAGNGSTAQSFSKTYRCTGTASYWGSTSKYGQGPYSLRSANNSIYQGIPGGTLNQGGDQYGFALFNYRQMRSDLAGATINSIYLQLTNLGSWYSNGTYVVLGYTTFTGSFGSFFQPGAGTHEGLQTVWQNEGATTSYNVTSMLSTHLTSDFTAIAIGPASSVGQSSNKSYYGYWYGYAATDNRTPQITVNYTAAGGSTESAGNGADGQVQITYNGGNTLVGAFSPGSGTDVYGNAYNPGSTTVQHTFLTIGSNPATPNTGQVITSSNPGVGQLQTTTADGNTQSVATARSGGGGQSFTTTGFQSASDGYSIPAANVQTGTVYRLTAWGHGTTGNPAVDLHFNIAGGNAETDMPSSAQNSNSGIQWEAVAHIRFTSSSAANITLRVSVSGFPGASGWSMVGNSRGYSPTFPYTFQLFGKWNTGPNGATATCDGSLFERLAN